MFLLAIKVHEYVAFVHSHESRYRDVAHWCSRLQEAGLEHGLRAIRRAFIFVKPIYTPVCSTCAYVSTGTKLWAFWAVRAIALSR